MGAWVRGWVDGACAQQNKQMGARVRCVCTFLSHFTLSQTGARLMMCVVFVLSACFLAPLCAFSLLACLLVCLGVCLLMCSFVCSCVGFFRFCELLACATLFVVACCV